MCGKGKNGAACIRGIKNINLNKIQRSNEQVSQDKESLERHNDSLCITKGPQIREFRALSM